MRATFRVYTSSGLHDVQHTCVIYLYQTYCSSMNRARRVKEPRMQGVLELRVSRLVLHSWLVPLILYTRLVTLPIFCEPTLSKS